MGVLEGSTEVVEESLEMQMMRDFPSGNTPGANPRDSTLHMAEAAAAAVMGTLSIAPLSLCALERNPASALAASASPAPLLHALSAQRENVTSLTQQAGESVSRLRLRLQEALAPRINYLSSAATRTSSIDRTLQG
jgi:hypothetical protein